MTTTLTKLTELMAKTRLPVSGERRDGTVKNCLLDSTGEPLVVGGDGYDGSYGFMSDEFSELVRHGINALPALIAVAQTMEDLAEHDCTYGDNCPAFGSRHGQCVGCVAREALLQLSPNDQLERNSLPLNKKVQP